MKKSVLLLLGIIEFGVGFLFGFGFGFVIRRTCAITPDHRCRGLSDKGKWCAEHTLPKWIPANDVQE
jgi:hypothetical protein